VWSGVGRAALLSIEKNAECQAGYASSISRYATDGQGKKGQILGRCYAPAEAHDPFSQAYQHFGAVSLSLRALRYRPAGMPLQGVAKTWPSIEPIIDFRGRFLS